MLRAFIIGLIVMQSACSDSTEGSISIGRINQENRLGDECSAVKIGDDLSLVYEKIRSYNRETKANFNKETLIKFWNTFGARELTPVGLICQIVINSDGNVKKVKLANVPRKS